MALKTFTINNGSANQALVTNGSGVLSFAAVGAAAGQVIQVVTATDETQRSTTSASFVTGSNTLSVTITPSSASNKVLILVSSGVFSGGNSTGFYTIFRGATNLGASNNGMGLTNDGAVGASANIGLNILDSPNTTSAITYQVYMKNPSSNTMYINWDNTKGSITCLEVKG